MTITAGTSTRIDRTRPGRYAARATLLLLLAVCSDAPADRAQREMIQAFEAYAVYKMGRYDEARIAFLDLAERGNTQGMLNLAHLYAQGQGLAADPQTALHWYRRAADAGNAIGMFYTGRAYELGLGAPANTAMALDFYQRAAAADVGEAQFALGRLLLRTGDDQSGMDWIRRAATSGLVEARAYLAADSAGDGRIDEDRARGINSALASIDRAAAARNAPGVVHYLRSDAAIRVSLPGTSAAEPFDRSRLQSLWQRSFDTAEAYLYRRISTELSAAGDGVEVQSLIEEQIGAGDEAQILRIHETSLFEFGEYGPRIARQALRIERLSP